MSLRRKDDWDEALEEARNNAITRGATFVPGPDYGYGASIVIPMAEILGEDTKTPNVELRGGAAFAPSSGT